MTPTKAVILMSGGLNSATCLVIAVPQGYECHTLAFSYDQRHSAELAASAKLSTQLGGKSHTVITMNMSAIGQSALTDTSISVPDYNPQPNEIPVTYVPARNTVFLSFGLAKAEALKADTLFIGVNAIDYPDCHPEFIQPFTAMAGLATKRGVEGHPIRIENPLISMIKAKKIRTEVDLGIDYGDTISCCRADESGRAWGQCDSCPLRAKGFLDAQIADPTHYRC